ncbi:hypothetical protein H8F21_15535 [Pseudomonas sp. P66]|uniref:Radical SAM protein n=1 Tax=Pseudomonas arcuscaelestis TaxID=2710591 RepID=A0ABS2BZG4_9PSED|nr:hypothetical protein [Pseudomonas arcuscaelestis]MBM5458979.1 hypothetical protein [Pseudomonas arcuscaelestis]
MRSEAVGFINVTRQCNVDCKRCYLTEEHRAAKERLPVSILERFLDSSFWLERDCTLIWEGGEPSVIGSQAMQLLIDTARRALPRARQTMVTNCFSVPDWLVSMVRREFDGLVETTYALGNKFNLAGSETAYQERFLAGLNKFWIEGIPCVVNVELNAETVRRGPDVLADVMLQSQCKVWEFDISVDFARFLRSPIYHPASTPALPLTVPYQQAWAFLSELRDRLYPRLHASGIRIGVFEQSIAAANMQFNVLSEDRFLTLNPDGTVTTNPLYSDLVETFLGNLCVSDLNEMITSRNRLSRVAYERKRVRACRECQHVSYCGGGPAHVPVFDGSGECAGGLSLWDSLRLKSA